MPRLGLLVLLATLAAPLEAEKPATVCFRDDLLMQYMDEQSRKFFWGRDMRFLEDALLEEMSAAGLCLSETGLEVHILVKREPQGWHDCPYNVFGCYTTAARLSAALHTRSADPAKKFSAWEELQEPREARLWKPTMQRLARSIAKQLAHDVACQKCE